MLKSSSVRHPRTHACVRGIDVDALGRQSRHQPRKREHAAMNEVALDGARLCGCEVRVVKCAQPH
jgi:hypothetical protein